ncbi:hypothetical protein EDC04DRAFT_2904358 [Pisolithus marmoratus]|nr:hypothetical protein EDC04DRAFT_2904358 [Pisolithus marmoratus]
MPPKSLSTTTLALRFMKNGAHGHTEQQAAALEQAHIKDDAEWEVSEEVRRAWEVVHEGDVDRKCVSYEQSYLPFLFPSLLQGEDARIGGHEQVFHAGMKVDIGDDHSEESDCGDETRRHISAQNTVSLRPRGRRTFDKHGREVFVQAHASVVLMVKYLYVSQMTSTSDDPLGIPTDRDAITTDSSTAAAKKLGRLKSISSFGKPQSPKKGKEKISVEGTEIDKEKWERDPSKTAKNIIRDISGVGTDLRAQRPSGFMKPQGVDAPVRVNVKEDGSSTPVPPTAVDMTSTRRRDKVKMKRVGDAARLQGRDGPPKKKPKLEMIE